MSELPEVSVCYRSVYLFLASPFVAIGRLLVMRSLLLPLLLLLLVLVPTLRKVPPTTIGVRMRVRARTKYSPHDTGFSTVLPGNLWIQTSSGKPWSSLRKRWKSC